MCKKIIGYYDYFYDKYEYSRIGNGAGKLYEDSPPNDVEKFFYNDKICPFCRAKLETVFIATQNTTIGRDLFFSGDVFECPKCSWWTYKTHFSESDDYIDKVNAIYTDERYYAITKSFNIDDKNIPIEVLTAELKKKTELLYRIDPYKLEELSQSILKDVYDCEVHHVGKTGDGGIDLIVLESDMPILVQIKRRQNPNHVELVKGVREFVGTLFIEDKRKGIYISTAKSFSRGSKQIVQKLLDDRKLDFFEFVDYDKLCALIDTTRNEKGWEKLVQPFYAEANAFVYDNKESIMKFRKRLYKVSSEMFKDI